MKKINLFILLCAVLFAMCSVSVGAAEAEDYPIPECTQEILDEDDLDTFFSEIKDASDKNLYSGMYEELKKEYANSQFDVTNNVFGMAFGATEQTIDSNNPYKSYNVDFELSSSEAATVILAGNYGDYGTLILGIFDFEAGTPVRVMESLTSDETWMYIPYSMVVESVKNFRCVAIPVTQEFLNVCEKYNITSFGDVNLADCTPTSYETTLSLSLKIYKTEFGNQFENGVNYEPGVNWVVSGPNKFTYHGSIGNNLMVVKNMNIVSGEDGNTYYPVHIYGTVNSLKYRKVGFDISAVCGDETKTETFETDEVYETVKVKETEKTAGELGGKYIFGGEIRFSTEEWNNADTVITVTPFVVFSDGSKCSFDKFEGTVKGSENPLFNVVEGN